MKARVSTGAGAIPFGPTHASRSPIIRPFKLCLLSAYARLAVLALAAVLVSLPAQATEGGGHNVATGALTWGAGYMPAAGSTVFAGYFLWLRAGSVRDNAGASVTPEFRADLYAHAGRVLSSWGAWRGLTFTSGIVYVADYSKVKVGTSRDENVDLSDFDWEPLYLSGKLGNWHFVTGPNVWMPLGKYNPKDPASASIHYGHYWTFIYEAGLTWQPSPRFELSMESSVARNLRNMRTQYRSGDNISFDIGATGQPIAGVPLGLGAGAFWFKQVSDDYQNGVRLPHTHLTALAIGPQISWTFSPGVAVILKYQHHLRVVNGARGDLVWFEWTLPLNLSHWTHGGSPSGTSAPCCAPGPAMPVPQGSM